MKLFAQYDTIIQPIYSEKSSLALESGQVLFEVMLKANKEDIKYAIEKVFEVDVVKINTVVRKGKVKKFRGKKFTKKNRKFAYVKIKQGQNIDLTAQVK